MAGEAATTADALAACRELRPDVVLADLGLPADDGADVIDGAGVADVLLGALPGLAVVGLCEGGRRAAGRQRDAGRSAGLRRHGRRRP